MPYGHKQSKETREKLRQINLGKKASKETKLKMSKSHKGLNTWSKGCKWSDVNRAKKSME